MDIFRYNMKLIDGKMFLYKVVEDIIDFLIIMVIDVSFTSQITLNHNSEYFLKYPGNYWKYVLTTYIDLLWLESIAFLVILSEMMELNSGPSYDLCDTPRSDTKWNDGMK